MRTIVRVVPVVLVVLVWVSSLSSSAMAAPGQWHEGVAEGAKARAREAFALGTAMIADAFFVRGVQHLREARSHWDHPAIHFNLAKGLMNLDQPADALVALWSAMRHGGRPLSLAQVEQVERLSGLLLREVAVLEVLQPRGPIEVDGQVVQSGAGAWTGFVKPGVHKVSGREVVVPVGSLVTLAHGEPKEAPLDTADLSALMQATVGFAVRFPSAAERAAWEPNQPPSDPMPTVGEALPGPAKAACDRAERGDLATVCRHYEADRKMLARLSHDSGERAREAMARLREMTRGGLVQTLE